MTRLFSIIFFSFLFLSSTDVMSQKKSRFTFDNIYRPVYGYVKDTVTNNPLKGVSVYSFDSMEDAMVGRKALLQSRNPMTQRLAGDVATTVTDESGRYMMPVLSRGVLIFHIKDLDMIVVEEVNGRSNVSLCRKEKKKERVVRSRYIRSDLEVPQDDRLMMNFTYYLPYSGDRRNDSRLMVERQIRDLETGEKLSSFIPVVYDGKSYHDKRSKAIKKGKIEDTLYYKAAGFPFLTDRLFEVPVKDTLNIDQWNSICYRLDYILKIENEGVVSNLDTMHIMTNRVNRPLQFLEYDFTPFTFQPELETESQDYSFRNLVLSGTYMGEVPEVLKDSSYHLRRLNVKAVVPPYGAYNDNMSRADSLMENAYNELKLFFSDKIDSDVRILRTIEVLSWNQIAESLEKEGVQHVAEKIRRVVSQNRGSIDVQTEIICSMPEYQDVVRPVLLSMERVEHLYEFRTARSFSKQFYMKAFAEADSRIQIEELCARAIEESVIFEGRAWDYAANLLAAIRMERKEYDACLLTSFIDSSLHECNVRFSDPISGKSIVLNRPEIVANQAMILMGNGRVEEALALAGILPDGYSGFVGLLECKAGYEPADSSSIERIASTSPRNRVVMSMYCSIVDEKLGEVLMGMPENDAVTWYLRARYLCALYGNDTIRLKESWLDSDSVIAFDAVVDCLRKCFVLDDSLITKAKLDAGIDESALKEVLGVYVL